MLARSLVQFLLGTQIFLSHARIRLINSPSTLKPLYLKHELECLTKFNSSRSPSEWWAPDFSHFKKKREVTENCASASLGTWAPSTLQTNIMWRKGSHLASLAWLITKKQKSEIAGKILKHRPCIRHLRPQYVRQSNWQLAVLPKQHDNSHFLHS